MRRRRIVAVRSRRAASGGTANAQITRGARPPPRHIQSTPCPDMLRSSRNGHRRPQIARGRLDAISAGSWCCAQRQRSGGPLRDTRRALCHVVRRFWQTRYRLVWDRSSSSTPSDPGATSNQMFSKISRGRGTGPGAVLPSWLPTLVVVARLNSGSTSFVLTTACAVISAVSDPLAV